MALLSARMAMTALVCLAAGCRARPAAKLPLVRHADLDQMAAALDSEELYAYRLSRSCEGGELSDCQRLGGLYMVGHGVPRIPAHAVSLWTYSCAAGEGLACQEIARLHERGHAVEQSPEQAAAFFERACKADRPSACTTVGLYQRDGKLGEPRPRKAVRWFRRGCRDGDPGGCHELALAHLSGSGVGVEPRAAVALLIGACDDSYARACTQLAVLYDEGKFVEANVGVAGAYREQACSAGDGAVCTALGWVDLAPQGDGREAALRHFGIGCGHGDAQACALMGRAYELGEGVPVEPERAFDLYRIACKGGVGEACGRAMAVGETAGVDGELLREMYRSVCDAGDPNGCHYLAGLYRDGVGGERDLPAAAKLYERSCGARVASACVEFAFMRAATEPAQPFSWLQRACEIDGQTCAVLGEIHEHGFWGRSKPAVAAKYYERACAADSSVGCHRLATLYYRGEGVERDDGTAARLHMAACDAGEGESCASLGFMHRKGVGVSVDHDLAEHYRTRACDLGVKGSCRIGPAPTPVNLGVR